LSLLHPHWTLLANCQTAIWGWLKPWQSLLGTATHLGSAIMYDIVARDKGALGVDVMYPINRIQGGLEVLWGGGRCREICGYKMYLRMH